VKVLFLSKYIYEETKPEFTINRTGFGLMVKDIAEGVSKQNYVGLLTRVITGGYESNNYIVFKHTWKDVFKSFTFKFLIRGIIEAVTSRVNFRSRLKIIYFNLDNGYTKKIVKEFKPDIIHIHGIGESSKSYINLCNDLNIPYVVTLHGLIGLDDSVLASKLSKELEKRFLQESEEKNIPVTVISSGIKKRIIKSYGLKSGENINVIANGTRTNYESAININIREKHNISSNNYIITCLGNISERKNQIQIVDAINSLPKEISRSITVLFLGNDGLNGMLQKRVRELELEKNFVSCGFVDKQEIPSYFKEGDLNVVASLDEGFGLSMIEGFVYGVPTVTFSDLDAIEDIYNDKAMMLVHERNQEALAESMLKALKKDWDKKWIKDYSKQFSLDKMAQNYHKLYIGILESRNNIEKN
jgi:glycosyltransferase involved in cell wall biosynthesis